MPNLSGVIQQLKKERDRAERKLSGLEAALKVFANAYSGKPVRKKRTMSAQSRAKIAAAQRRRWAKFRAKRKN